MKLFSENIYMLFFLDTLSPKQYNINVNKIRKLVNIMMKYTIYYSIPDDIYCYKMNAKDEKQLVKFLKMLTDEKAYNFRVEVINYEL